MEIVLIVICGLLTSIGVYLILSKSLIRIIIGTALLS
ncbi:Na(+)/H(+) antiporter subunit C, partial [Staphylococcus equorum]